jgi:pimeloyl-ACP methyl ester carboxylesterase
MHEQITLLSLEAPVRAPLPALPFVEYPVFFAARERELFGVLTEPREAAREVGIVLLTGGACVPGTNRNRLSVHLARRLAELGFHVLRFDFHGVGESQGSVDVFRLDRPFSDDLDAAAGVLRAAGLRRVVFIGSCFGSRTILAAADRVPELAAAVLMSTPLGDDQMGDVAPMRYARGMSLVQMVRKALRPQTLRSLLAPSTREAGLRQRHMYRRTAVLKVKRMAGHLLGRTAGRRGADAGDEDVSQEFLRGFRQLAKRRIPVLMLYGDADAFYKDFTRASHGLLAAVLEDAQTVQIETVAGAAHGFTTLSVQRDIRARVEAWVSAVTQA